MQHRPMTRVDVPVVTAITQMMMMTTMMMYVSIENKFGGKDLRFRGQDLTKTLLTKTTQW